MNEEEGSDYINANYIPVSTETGSVERTMSCTAVRVCHLQIPQDLLESQSHSQHLLQVTIFCLQGIMLFDSHQKKKKQGGSIKILRKLCCSCTG